MRRRFLGRLLAGSAAMACLPMWARANDAADVDHQTKHQQPQAATKESAAAQHQAAMEKHAEALKGDLVKIGFLIYPGMFLQDLVGPLAVFESLMNREIYLLWKDKAPVVNDDGSPTLIPVQASHTFAECPEHLDVLLVPGGGSGTLSMMEDQEVLHFLREQGKNAKFIASVCTGSLILGAAGLLQGYRASSYWAALDVLKDLGAIPVKKRVVIDRNRMTGGGVTAGIDLALTIVPQLRSVEYAKIVQLYLEYDPQPPFDAGSPSKAPPAAKRFILDMFEGFVSTAREAAKRARASWPSV
ncbi:DJ-1/PfpI family protein [Undibacterium danionis]|uniref:DJ-1/PfpI family protein n=1 Tax=Undibacterium danionis TaxID=1812100 RepID=A0ABV6IDD4_9BURK